MSLWLLAVSAALATEPGGPPSMTLDEVVAANADAVANLRSLVVKLKNYQTKRGGSGADDLDLAIVYTYRKQGDQERITADSPLRAATSTGDRPGYTDGSNGPDGFRMMFGYDPSRPAALGEVSESRAYGQLAPRKFTDRPMGQSPAVDLLLQVGLGSKSWPLADLVKTSTSASIVARPADSPRHCYEIEAKRPEMNFRISLDPAANFMIRRVEHIPTPASKPKFNSTLEVVAFKDCGDGIFLPSETRAELSENQRTMRFRSECEVVSVNRPIPSEDLAVKFPDWLLVIDNRAGKVHYWGPDEKPRLTFENADAHQRWLQPRLARLERDKLGRNFPWSIVMGALTAGVAVFAIVRSRRRSRIDA